MFVLMQVLKGGCLMIAFALSAIVFVYTLTLVIQNYLLIFVISVIFGAVVTPLFFNILWNSISTKK